MVKHYKYKKPDAPHRVFPNLFMTELKIDGPLECIVSDMAAFYVKGVYYELTLYMDLWNNEIISHSLSARRGDRMTYISGLKDLLARKGSTRWFCTPTRARVHFKSVQRPAASLRRARCPAPGRRWATRR